MSWYKHIWFRWVKFVLLLMGSGPKDDDVLYDAGHPCLSIHLSKIGFPWGAGLGRLEGVVRSLWRAGSVLKVH